MVGFLFNFQTAKQNNVDMQAYSEMIHGIVVSATLSQEEMFKCYQPLTDFLQAETPEKLYRFRRCDEKIFLYLTKISCGFHPDIR